MAQGVHTWWKAPTAHSFAASSMSAFSRTTALALPPNSMSTGFRFLLAIDATILPTSELPVKLIFLIAGYAIKALVTFSASSGRTVIILRTPSGSPASLRIDPMAWKQRGASSEPFRTVVLPAARAYMIARNPRIYGAFLENPWAGYRKDTRYFVPRCYAKDNPVWLPQYHCASIFLVIQRHLAFDIPHSASDVSQLLYTAVYVQSHPSLGGTCLQPDVLGKFFGSRGDQIGCSEKDVPAGGGFHFWPTGKCELSSFRSFQSIARGRGGAFPQEIACSWILDLEGGFCSDLLPIDLQRYGITCVLVYFCHLLEHQKQRSMADADDRLEESTLCFEARHGDEARRLAHFVNPSCHTVVTRIVTSTNAWNNNFVAYAPIAIYGFMFSGVLPWLLHLIINATYKSWFNNHAILLLGYWVVNVHFSTLPITNYPNETHQGASPLESWYRVQSRCKELSSESVSIYVTKHITV